MEDDAQGVAGARGELADPVAEIDPVGSPRAGHRAVVDREDQGVPLPQRGDPGPRLHPGPLLGDHELPTGEVAARLGEQDRHLQREDVLAIEVLVQAVVVAGAVLQQQRGGAALTGGVAAVEEGRMLLRKVHPDPHGPVPAIGRGGQARIEGGPQVLNRVGQGIGEVLVLTAPEAVAGHDHLAAEAGGLAIEAGHIRALGGGEQARDHRRAPGVEIALDARPVEARDAIPEAGGLQGSERAHAAASRSSRARLRSTPQA